MSATCGRCGGPMPRGWFFVMLCDDCLSKALAGLAKTGGDVPDAEIAGEETAGE